MFGAGIYIAVPAGTRASAANLNDNNKSVGESISSVPVAVINGEKNTRTRARAQVCSGSGDAYFVNLTRREEKKQKERE